MPGACWRTTAVSYTHLDVYKRQVQTGSGMAGESLLRLKVAKNTRAEARSATITVSVGGYASPVSFVVKEGKGLSEQGDGKYRLSLIHI